MSMSQEEIEALMNDSADMTATNDAPTEVEEVVDDTPMSEDDIAALIAETDNTETTDESEPDMDELLAGIDGITEDDTDSSQEEIPDIDMEDLLAGIDGITDDETTVEPTPEVTSIPEPQIAQSVESIMNAQIDQGVYPLPVEKEHKVVNQLNEVAEDSEEKASQIFDVLSFILDENSEIQNNTKAIEEYVSQQTKLLETLVQKFPKIEVLSTNLEASKNISTNLETILSKLNEENNQIFNAMDLMQYHDINRQKIERVMSVIKKLTTYLNGIFEDDSGKAEVQVAKHISGDASDTVSEDDIDSLISEFTN